MFCWPVWFTCGLNFESNWINFEKKSGKSSSKSVHFSNIHPKHFSVKILFKLMIYAMKSLFTPRTFKIDRITIFIFSFCRGLVTQLNDSALGVLKHHYITERIRELLIGNSRFLIYNLLNQSLYYTV